jgi:hypothetical protein
VVAGDQSIQLIVFLDKIGKIYGVVSARLRKAGGGG